MHLSGAQFLCRAAESEARCGHVNLRTGFSGRHQPPPLLPSHTCQGGCPQWSWGSDPGVGLHGFASSPCLLTSASQRGRRRARLARGPFPAQHVFPVSALGDYARRHRTSDQRETPSVTSALASSVCDFSPKTHQSLGHTSQVSRPLGY